MTILLQAWQGKPVISTGEVEAEDEGCRLCSAEVQVQSQSQLPETLSGKSKKVISSNHFILSQAEHAQISSYKHFTATPPLLWSLP